MPFISLSPRLLLDIYICCVRYCEGWVVIVFPLFIFHFPRGPHLFMNRLFLRQHILHGLKRILLYSSINSTITLTHSCTQEHKPCLMRVKELLLLLVSQTLCRLVRIVRMLPTQRFCSSKKAVTSMGYKMIPNRNAWNSKSSLWKLLIISVIRYFQLFMTSYIQ